MKLTRNRFAKRFWRFFVLSWSVGNGADVDITSENPPGLLLILDSRFLINDIDDFFDVTKITRKNKIARKTRTRTIVKR